MEKRYCLECGEGFWGRSDKRFCCDACRNSYHNAISRQSKAYSYKINSILHRNHSILSESLQSGKLQLDRKEMEEKQFAARFHTASKRKPLRRTVYTCYDISYRIEGRKGVRILTDSK